MMIDTLLPKKELNPEFWPEGVKGELNPEIHIQLIKIAEDFKNTLVLKDLGINQEVKVVDAFFTGSLANYNWSEYSDVDLHIQFDLSDIPEGCKKVVEAYLYSMQADYKYKHNIKIKGYEVEIFPELSQEIKISAGVYSLVNKEWISKPSIEHVEIDKEYIQRKSKALMSLIDKLVDLSETEPIQEVSDCIERTLVRIKAFRQMSLDSKGEYAEGNLIFKVLRRLGYIQRLKDLKIDLTDKKLSLENQTS